MITTIPLVGKAKARHESLMRGPAEIRSFATDTDGSCWHPPSLREDAQCVACGVIFDSHDPYEALPLPTPPRG